jgi:hypothetical protein
VGPTIRNFKRNKLRREDVVLHRHEVRARRGSFSIFKDEIAISTFILGFSQLLAEFDFKIVVAALDKPDHYRTYGLSRVDRWLPTDVYTLLFTFVIERFTAFLREQGRVPGRIVAERRGRKEDASVQYEYSRMLKWGTQFYHAWQFREVLPDDDIKFRRKKENVIGLQMADWMATPFSKKVQAPDGSLDEFGEWDLYKGKIWLGKSAPQPGQVGFKTFPKNLGRKLLNVPLKSA